MKIYVGNLSYESSDSSLESLFATYGTIQEVTLITDRETGRPRGFGFVTMDDEGGTKAIEALNGQEFDGRTLNVNEARSKGNRGAV